MANQEGAASAGTISVVVLEDHEMVASALEAALAQDPRLRVVATAGRLEEAIEVVAEHQPDVLVSDLRLHGVEISDQLPRLAAAAPGVAILVVTGWATERTLFDSLDNGARGFIAKAQGLDELVDAVVRVAQGETVVAPPLLPALVGRTSQGSGRDRAQLTPRELEVLGLLGDGIGTKDIAARLGVSPNTVRNHVRALLAKLDASTRLEAVTIARRMDLIAPIDR